MTTRSIFVAIGVWVAVALLAMVVFLQWRQLEALTAEKGIPVTVLEIVGQPLVRIDTPTNGLRVDLAYLSANEGVFNNIEGGFIQTSPLRLIDEDGEFDRYFRIPVGLSEPIDVWVDGGELDVWVDGGSLNVDNLP